MHLAYFTPQWELYNRCPHVPAFAFTSEITAVGNNADFVDLLLLRCRFEVGTINLVRHTYLRPASREEPQYQSIRDLFKSQPFAA